MLRDNIAWTAISDKLSTRTEANCCLKWYDQLTSPMVAKGEWADVDDYRLVDALFELDASCIEDVDWDNLLDHRPGEICRKRWNQMVLHIGKLKNSSFAEQIEVLAKRYRPDFAEDVPASVASEDQKVLAFRDLNPQAPVDVLVIPKSRDGF
ncbi:14 kDa zinc-binding protein [Capsicum chinense]|nr:14 kDa zinc-binding protein [Capsicum chinense]